jgi:hypothetical protein
MVAIGLRINFGELIIGDIAKESKKSCRQELGFRRG